MPFLRSRPELLERFRRGDRAALSEVYWAYVDRVERVVRFGFAIARKGIRVGGARQEEIADLVQETFMRAFAEPTRKNYDGLRDFGPLLSTIARNLLVDWARKRGREIVTDELPESGEAPQDEPPWADERTLRVVEEYLANLQEDLRSVHRERYERGLSQEAAASALGLSRQQLRTREMKLRDGLAEALRMAQVSD